MATIQNITLKSRIDRAEIDAAILAGTEIVLYVTNEYDSGLPSAVEINVNEMDPTTLEVFKTMCDVQSWPFEALCPVWKVDYDSGTKTFDFGRSYLRDDVSTETGTSLDDGAPLVVRFEFAGFASNEVVEATVLYNDDFSTEDKELLAAHGVNVLAAGTGFSFTNSRECKVYFFKPDSVEGNYIVQYPALGTVIPAESGA